MYEPIHYIYRIDIGPYFYYGRTKQTLRERADGHLRDLKNGRKKRYNYDFYKAWKDNGKKELEIYVVDMCLESEVLALEDRWIKQGKLDPYCVNIGDAECGASFGSGHPSYDHTIHKFEYKTGEIFESTQQEFGKTYGIPKGMVCALINERIKTAHGWRLFGTDHSFDLGFKGKKHYNYDHTIYTFEHTETGERFEGTQYEFREKFSLDKASVSRLVKGTQKTCYKWICLNPKPL